MALSHFTTTSTSLTDIAGGDLVYVWALEALTGAVTVTCDTTAVWNGTAAGDSISFPRGLGPFTQVKVSANGVRVYHSRDAR